MSIYFIPGNHESEQAAIQKLFGFFFKPSGCPETDRKRFTLAHSHLMAASAGFVESGRKAYAATDPETGATAYLRILAGR